MPQRTSRTSRSLRRGRRLALSALVTLATPLLALGCSGAADGEAVGSSHEAITPRYGCDYSFARPSPASIKAQGFSFVARYLSYSAAKDLSAGEANELIAAGLDIVDNWEESSTAALNGFAQGASDARQANAEAAADGAPSTRPIYFSIDFDASAAQQAVINDYFDGVASVIGVARTGAYGGYSPIQRLFDAGKITFAWQTYAWSYGQWDPRAQLRQIQNGIYNDEEDEDEAVAADFGQWGPGSPTSAPPPAPARGSLDSVTCDLIAGWAEDPGSAGVASPVDLYLDGPAGTGTGIGRFTASNPRADLCTAIGSCNHGFSIPTPTSLYDGHAHTIYAYAIAVTPGAANALLGNAPQPLHCATALAGDFEGTGHTLVAQFRDDWQSLPTCGRFGSEWSCENRTATYVGGVGAGNAGTAVYPGATPLVGDVNGDGLDDVLEWNDAAASIPVCFSTGHEWACENLDAHYEGGLGAGNVGSGVYPGGAPLVGDVNGDGKADLIQYNASWGSFPTCFATDEGWACRNTPATYVGGIGAGNDGYGVYGSTFGTGTQALVGDVNGDGQADVVQYNPTWISIPVCFSTGHGWSCENLPATYVAGLGAGNSGSGVYGSTTVKLADVNGDGKADLVQYNPEWASIPVCFSTGRGWSCENQKAEYVGGLGAGNSGSGLFGSAFGDATMLIADVNGDGKADLVQYSDAWQSLPTCFSTGKGWSCENLKADLPASTTPGNAGTGVYPFGVPVAGTFDGGKASGVLQIDPDSGWTTLPLCGLGTTSWNCSNAAATVY